MEEKINEIKIIAFELALYKLEAKRLENWVKQYPTEDLEVLEKHLREMSDDEYLSDVFGFVSVEVARRKVSELSAELEKKLNTLTDEEGDIMPS